MCVLNIKSAFRYAYTLIVLVTLILMASPVLGSGYANALKGVKSYDAVFEFSQGNPKVANIVFWAVKNSYEVDEVKALSQKPKIAIVFHGPAVKLLSTDRALFNDADWAEVEKFQNTLRQMKQDGMKMEVCLYAAEVMGVDEWTIIPEIDRVGNGFVSVIGYQQQGYSIVRIP